MREALAIGVGCTRGTPCAVLSAGIAATLAQHGLSLDAVCRLGSLDAKRDEAGIVALARSHGWALSFFDAAALAQVATVHPSPVVQARVGTPGVAEPAAILAAGMGWLRVPKTVFAADGHAMTLAIAALRSGHDG